MPYQGNLAHRARLRNWMTRLSTLANSQADFRRMTLWRANMSLYVTDLGVREASW